MENSLTAVEIMETTVLADSRNVEQSLNTEMAATSIHPVITAAISIPPISSTATPAIKQASITSKDVISKMEANGYIISTKSVVVPAGSTITTTKDNACCGFTVTAKAGDKTHKIRFLRSWGWDEDITCCLITGLPWLIYSWIDELAFNHNKDTNMTRDVFVLYGYNKLNKIDITGDTAAIWFSDMYAGCSYKIFQAAPQPQTQAMS